MSLVTAFCRPSVKHQTCGFSAENQGSTSINHSIFLLGDPKGHSQAPKSFPEKHQVNVPQPGRLTQFFIGVFNSADPWLNQGRRATRIMRLFLHLLGCVDLSLRLRWRREGGTRHYSPADDTHLWRELLLEENGPSKPVGLNTKSNFPCVLCGNHM